MKGDIGCYLQSIHVAVARSRCIHIPWRGEGRWQFRHISMFCQLLAREMTRLVHCLWEHLPYPRERLPRERESAGAGRGREASDWLFIPARHIRRVGSKRAALAISMLQPRPLIPLPPPPPFPAPIRRSGRGSAPAPARLRAHVRLTVWALAFAEYGDGSLVGILRSFRKSFSLADGSVAGDDGAVVTGNFCVSDFLLSGTTMDFSLY